MSKPIFFIFSLILMFQFSYTQNQENCNYGVIPYDDGGTYQGCRNYKGKANGEGKLTLPNVFIYIGMFKDGKFHGSGEFTYANGNKYVGSFENNMFSGQGTMTSNFDDQNHISEGFFSEDMLLEGTKTINYNNGLIDTDDYKDFKLIKSVRKNENGTLVSETIGEFYPNDRLKKGEIINYDGNLKTYLQYENGKEVSRSTNIDNVYNKQDIVGSDDTLELDLIVEGYTKYLNLNFFSDGVPYEFVFDTGANDFMIGNLLFKELKDKGLSYEDMHIEVESRGVTGIPFKSKVIKINEILIGSYTIKNIFAKVPLLETANYSLLGISFMKKFKDVKWSLNDNKLTFEK
jgi:hypothetical protein